MKKSKLIMKKIVLSLMAIVATVYLGINLVVWLNVNRLMSEVQNNSMCEIAADAKCFDYLDRTDAQIERAFTITKNDFSTIAAIKIYQKRYNKKIEKLKEKKELTDKERETLEVESKWEIYHQKILKVVNENLDVNEMSFLERRIYKSLMRR